MGGGGPRDGGEAGRRGIREAMTELGSLGRKNLKPSAGQAALSRGTHALLNAAKRLHDLTSEQVVPPSDSPPLARPVRDAVPCAFQVIWQDGCFSVSAEAKWDESRRGKDVVLSNNNTTVTRSNGNEWGGVLGSQCFTAGQHTFTFQIGAFPPPPPVPHPPRTRKKPLTPPSHAFHALPPHRHC